MRGAAPRSEQEGHMFLWTGNGARTHGYGSWSNGLLNRMEWLAARHVRELPLDSLEGSKC